jgi:hypothetical protein
MLFALPSEQEAAQRIDLELAKHNAGATRFGRNNTLLLENPMNAYLSQPPPPVRAPAPALAEDLLRGADQIAEFLFGDPEERRKVYHLAETSRLPVFRLGAVLCARRSVLLEWIAHQENRGWPRGRP